MSLVSNRKTYIIEHLDPELGEWSALEYLAIAKESKESGASFCLSLIPRDLKIPTNLKEYGTIVEHRGVEEMNVSTKERICLLDPAASVELQPKDGDDFDVFLFGGILGRTRLQTLR